MQQLVLNGVQYDEPLPPEWTIQELVTALEQHVLVPNEVVVDIRVDGAQQSLAVSPTALTLGDVDRLDIEARRVDQVLDEGVAIADQTVTNFCSALDQAIDGFQTGREADGWAAYQRGLSALAHFNNLLNHFRVVQTEGKVLIPERGDRLVDFAGEFEQRLQALEPLLESRDLVELCDELDEFGRWLVESWSTLWAPLPSGEIQ